ncbi:hypothetical protein F9V30_24330 [Escherichia coli]|nr:hypothetical protein [Escherichia coli]
MSIKNDGHYFCRAGGNRPDGLNEPVTDRSGYHRVPETVSCRRSLQGLCAFFTTWLFRMNHTEI